MKKEEMIQGPLHDDVAFTQKSTETHFNRLDEALTFTGFFALS